MKLCPALLTMPFSTMAFDSYGLSKEQFRKIFLEETENLVDLFTAMKVKAEARGLKLEVYEDKFVWDFFQEVGYRAEDAARVHQKKNDPEAIKEHSFDYGLMPSREEMMEEIKSLHAKIEALADYVAKLVSITTDGLNGISETLTDVVD